MYMCTNSCRAFSKMGSNILNLTIKEVLSRLRDRSLTVSDLCEACITRAKKVRELNAFITETHAIAQQRAVQADYEIQNGGSHGEAHGIPVAFKDNFSTTGIQTSCASNMLKGYHPPYNATMVHKMLAQGAMLMGKTNMDEFAMGSGTTDSIYGPVRNPWGYKWPKVQSNHHQQHRRHDHHHSLANVQNTRLMSTRMGARDLHGNSSHVSESDTGDWYVAGGSSGGSAVSVATGVTMIALGSDTGGSVRNPAAMCGIVGFKPTYGLLSRHGLIPLVNSCDVPGIFAKTVDDTTLAFNILAGHDIHDSTTVTDRFVPVNLPEDISVHGLHIGIPMEYHAPGTSEDVITHWRRVADMFENAGARVSQVSLPHTQHSIKCYTVLCYCEVASNMARYDGLEYGLRCGSEESTEALYSSTRHHGFNDTVRGRILAGNYFLLKRNYENYFLRAQKIRRLISEDFRKVFDSGVDLLLTPTTLSDAQKYSTFMQEDNRTRSEQEDVYTQPVNLAGIPAVTVPVGLSSNHMPIGLQLIGQSFQEEKLLSTAKWMEQQVTFSRLNLEFLHNKEYDIDAHNECC